MLDFLSLIRYSKNYCALDNITKLKGLGISIALSVVGVISLRVRTMASLLLAMGYFYFVTLNDVRIVSESMSLTFLFNWKIKTNVLSSKAIFSSLRMKGVTSVLYYSCKQ